MKPMDLFNDDFRNFLIKYGFNLNVERASGFTTSFYRLNNKYISNNGRYDVLQIIIDELGNVTLIYSMFDDGMMGLYFSDLDVSGFNYTIDDISKFNKDNLYLEVMPDDMKLEDYLVRHLSKIRDGKLNEIV